MAIKAQQISVQEQPNPELDYPGTDYPGREPSPSADPERSAKEVALAIAKAGLDKKAEEVELIEVTGKVDYADFVVVMSGRSDRQVAAIARGVEESLRELGVRCLGVEGVSQGAWVLMDFSDVIVHVFHEGVRGYYDLESLWIDAVRIPLEGEPQAAALT